MSRWNPNPPCPCGKPGKAGRYKGMGPALCNSCYQLKRAADPRAQSRYGRKYVEQAKKGKPCTDCGGQFPHYVLQWDHVPERGPKLFNLGRGDYSLAKLGAEIAKCDLVCANCHAVRTWNRRREQGVAPEAEEWLPVAGEEVESAVTADSVLF